MEERFLSIFAKGEDTFNFKTFNQNAYFLDLIPEDAGWCGGFGAGILVRVKCFILGVLSVELRLPTFGLSMAAILSVCLSASLSVCLSTSLSGLSASLSACLSGSRVGLGLPDPACNKKG